MQRGCGGGEGRPGAAGRMAGVPELLDKRLVFVTGKGGVGKSTVALALGLAAADRGQAHDRLRGRVAGARLARPSPSRDRLPRGRARGQPVVDLDRPRRVDARVPAAPAQGPRDGRPADPQPDLHLPRGGHPGPQGARHDREDLGAGAARPPRQEGPRVRPRDRRLAGDRARDRLSRDAADVRQHRARRPDPRSGPGSQPLPHRPREHRARRSSRFPRRCRSTSRGCSSAS